MYEALIILAMVLACVGIVLYFVGWVNTIFMALGKKQHVIGITLFVINPLSIIYCLKN